MRRGIPTAPLCTFMERNMDKYQNVMETLACDERVKKVLDHIKAHEQQTLDEQLELVAIKSPSNHEEERARRVYEIMKGMALDDVFMDSVNNVIGILKGTGKGPTLVLSGHTDTVFGFDVDCTPYTDEDGWIHAPGINDDTRGLAEVLTLARAMTECNVRGEGDIWFVGNVGEESTGNLRGTRQLFADHKDEIGCLVSIDGTPKESIYRTAVAGHKLKFTFRGRGGHAYGNFGIPNCNCAMGRAIAEISDIQVPAEPKTIFNVGVVNGGVSVNAIPSECSVLVDMRSTDDQVLAELVEKVKKAVLNGIDKELARWNHPTETLELTTEVLSVRPGGTQSDDCPIVRAATAANDYVGYATTLVSGSTDANIPISMGIPAIAIGRGGEGVGVHTVNEKFLPKDAYKSPQRACLLTLALSGLDGVVSSIL